MKREVTVDYNIKVLWHAISRMYNQQGSEYGITASIGFVLLNIDCDKGTPATKIAPLLGLETRSLTRMLKSLEEKGLVYREKDETDKRSVRIYLTEEGKRKRKISAKTVKAFNNKVSAIIPEEQLENFFDVINLIEKVIENSGQQDSPKKIKQEVTIN